MFFYFTNWKFYIERFKPTFVNFYIKKSPMRRWKYDGQKLMYITKQSEFMNDIIIFQTDKLPPHYGKRNTSENQFCGSKSQS